MPASWTAPRALLFDLDGTLVHSLPDLADAVDATLQQYGLPPLTEALIAPMIGNGSRKLVERALQASSWCAAPAHSAELLQEAHERFLLHYRQRLCVRSSLYPGVAEQLSALQHAGIQLAVVTNKPIALVAPLLESLGIRHHFALLIGGDSLAEKKPSPLPLLHACAHLEVAVCDSIMVGDSRNDVAAAQAAAMRCIAVSFGYNHGEPVAASAPDIVIDHFEQLPACWSR